MPDAGALVIATDHADAKAYAEQIQKITGEYPAASSLTTVKPAKIDEFREGMQRWMVAVRNGVRRRGRAPPRRGRVYATSTSTGYSSPRRLAVSCVSFASAAKPPVPATRCCS